MLTLNGSKSWSRIPHHIRSHIETQQLNAFRNCFSILYLMAFLNLFTSFLERGLYPLRSVAYPKTAALLRERLSIGCEEDLAAHHLNSFKETSKNHVILFWDILMLVVQEAWTTFLRNIERFTIWPTNFGDWRVIRDIQPCLALITLPRLLNPNFLQPKGLCCFN
jgi:hypothetical protein